MNVPGEPGLPGLPGDPNGAGGAGGGPAVDSPDGHDGGVPPPGHGPNDPHDPEQGAPDAAPAAGSGDQDASPRDAVAAPPPQALEWLGDWRGGASGHVVPKCYIDGEERHYNPEECKDRGGYVLLALASAPILVRVDTYEIGEHGWVQLGGRVSAGHCLLSTEFYATLFVGDSLSPVDRPVLQLMAAGQSDEGRQVHLTVTARRQGVPGRRSQSWAEGRATFLSMEPRHPCANKDLSFDLWPVLSPDESAH